MSNYHRQASRKSVRTQDKSRQYINYLARSLALIGLIAGGSPLGLSPLLAAPAAGGITIDNQATGTFADLDDTSAGTESVVSNVVSVTVAEVAGIIVTAKNTPSALVGSVTNFDFKIQNIGNDPTKFFLPTAPSSVTGGTAGTLQIVGYYLPGATSPINLTTPINITTATNTGGLTDPTLGGNTTLGSIPADAAIVVRVPVTVTATAGQTVAVTLGNSASNNTPYVAGTNDVYTVDNPDTPTISSEVLGTPINGDTTTHSQEGSATQSVLAISTGADFGDAPSDLSSIDASLNPAYPTLAVNNGASHTLDGIHYLGAGVSTETDGQPTLNADGDSQDDGVTFPTIGSQSAIVVGQNNTITVNASTTGILNAWIDWNQDGKWNSSEQIALNQAMTAGNNTITVNPLNTVPHGKTYARFRFSSQSNLQPTGAATDGEVEDYAINVAIPEITQCTAPLLNGGFELPNISGSTPTPLQVYDPNIKAYKEADVPGWASIMNNPNTFEPATTVAPFDQRNSIEIWRTGNSPGTPAYEGQQFAEINSYGFGRLHQDIITTPGVTMRWQFAHRGRAGSDTIRVKMGAPGATIDRGTYTTGNTGWKVYSGTYTIPSGQNITRFEFEAVSSATGNPGQGNFLDDIQFGVNCAKTISGTVFEDPNYGGGAGRNLATATTSPRDGATVELYKNDATGTYVGTTTTSGGGKYTFTGVLTGDYKVRVVNSTVTSSRPNPTSATGLVAVQTFRTDASVTAGTVTAVTNLVGGEMPKEIDAPANTTASLTTLNAVAKQEVQSLTTVKVGTSDITGIDFGYNFDTIVNTNDDGQGSLRQFIINSNALTGETNLAQSGNRLQLNSASTASLPVGKETSIFMIPVGTGSQLVSGVAPIDLSNTLDVTLPLITGNDAILDGTTQTVNQGDTNTGTFGTGGTVGVDNLALPTINKPEVQIAGNSAINFGLELSGDRNAIRGIAIYGFGTNVNSGLIRISGTDNFVENNIVGGSATSFTNQNTIGNGIITQSAASIAAGAAVTTGHIQGTIRNNLVGFVGGTGISIYFGGNNFNVVENEIKSTNISNNNISDGIAVFLPGTNNNINRNLILDSGAVGIDAAGFYNSTIDNNTISQSGRTTSSATGAEISGIRVLGVDNTVSKNIIYDNYGAGIMLRSNASIFTSGIKITQNSIYGNGTITNRSGAPATNQIGIDLLKTSDSASKGTSPYVSANDGLVGTGTNNNGMDYPIITTSNLVGNTLTVKGYVGNLSTGNPLFAGGTLEFFISEGTNQNNGEVILGDGKSKSHGEGKTYINSCLADSNGLFNCSFPTAGSIPGIDAKNITATFTKDGSTSEFSAPPSNKADVLMVKRITAIKDGVTGAVIPYSSFVDDTTSTTKTNDNNCGWPGATGAGGVCTTNTYTLGATSETALQVKPGDEIEYTIYYLNAGENKATQARVCDRLNNSLTFQTQFDSTLPATVGKGIGIAKNGGLIQYLTNDGIDTDKGQLTTVIGAGDSCNLAANTGSNLSDDVVVVDVGDAVSPLLGSAYGYIRIKTTVK